MVGVLFPSDYYPFGMLMPGDRHGSTENYRYGFNGMEVDNEVSGTGNHMTTPFRQYNPRLGRWMTTDPIVHPWQSPYAAFNDNPIYFADPSGLKGKGPKPKRGFFKRLFNKTSTGIKKKKIKTYDVTIKSKKSYKLASLSFPQSRGYKGSAVVNLNFPYDQQVKGVGFAFNRLNDASDAVSVLTRRKVWKS